MEKINSPEESSDNEDIFNDASIKTLDKNGLLSETPKSEKHDEIVKKSVITDGTNSKSNIVIEDSSDENDNLNGTVNNDIIANSGIENSNSLALEDLTKSLDPKYYIQVVRILNDMDLCNGDGYGGPYPSHGLNQDNESKVTSSMANVPSNKILYTIRSLKKRSKSDIFMVNRFHEDIEWLDHCLLTQNKAVGLIIPPIPTKPLESFQLAAFTGIETGAENGQNANKADGDFVNSSTFNATNYNYVQGADQSLTKSPYDKSILQHINHSFNYDCFNLERYLSLLLQHPVFGSDIILKRFLTEKNAPPHGKFKKGFLDRFTTAVSEMRKANQAEFDEFFQHERLWNTEYSTLLRDVLQAFSKKVEAIYQLAQVSGHFATALSMAHCNGPSLYTSFNQTLSNISLLFENLKQKKEELQAYYQLTLGFELDFYCRYLESHKDTLNRRNCLLLEYESCNKAYEKAKPPKKEMARQLKLIAEKSLQECSDTAKKEFVRFHNDQSNQIFKSIQNYANANLQKSKDIYDSIALTLDQISATL